jgi:hypothetical protein
VAAHCAASALAGPYMAQLRSPGVSAPAPLAGVEGTLSLSCRSGSMSTRRALGQRGAVGSWPLITAVPRQVGPQVVSCGSELRERRPSALPTSGGGSAKTAISGLAAGEMSGVAYGVLQEWPKTTVRSRRRT